MKHAIMAALAAALCTASSAKAAPLQAADTTDKKVSPAIVDSAKPTPTDISARRRHHHRYGGNRWGIVQPYPYYGYYGPRPYYYRPYPYYAPLPFGFGFGYNPYH